METAIRVTLSETVDRPYQEVCEILSGNAQRVFKEATTEAESSAQSMAAELHAKIAGVDVSKKVRINIVSYIDMQSGPDKQMVVELNWEATRAPHWFPTMVAQLSVMPFEEDKTRLDFQGEYEPPLGLIGQAVNAVVGHQIAESSVRQFVSEVANYLQNHKPQ